VFMLPRSARVNTMKSLVTMLFALGLAACANYGNLDGEGRSQLASPAQHVLSQTKSIPGESFQAKAEASKMDASKSISSSLMECVSDACKAQCAQGNDNQSRPKWCMYFKAPADRHAVSGASEMQRKSTE
jgi:hypothetical protein